MAGEKLGLNGRAAENGADVDLGHHGAGAELVAVLLLVAPRPFLQRGDDGGHAHHRVLALPGVHRMVHERPVHGLAVGGDLDEDGAALGPGDAELGRLHHDAVVPHHAVGHQVARAVPFAAVGGTLVVVHRRAADLPGHPRHDDVALELDAALLERLGHGQRAGERPLVIDDAAAVDDVVLPPGQRLPLGPGAAGDPEILLPARQSRVHVPVEKQRRPRALARNHAHHVGAPRLGVLQERLDALLLQPVVDEPRHLLLAPRGRGEIDDVHGQPGQLLPVDVGKDLLQGRLVGVHVWNPLRRIQRKLANTEAASQASERLRGVKVRNLVLDNGYSW